MFGRLNKRIKKVLIIFINICIIYNFIIPNYIYALDIDINDKNSILDHVPKFDDETQLGGDELNSIITNVIGSIEEEEQEEEGGALFTPISQFLLAIADGVMATMQGAFIGDEKISNLINSHSIKVTTPGDEVAGVEEGLIRDGVTAYSIKYSPAAIFSGKIPALDVNFFNPMGDDEGKTEFHNVETRYKREKNTTYSDCRANYGATAKLQSMRDTMSLTELAGHTIAMVCAVNAIEALANTDTDYDTLSVEGSFVVEAGASVPVALPTDAGLISIAAFTAAALGAEGIAMADRMKEQNLYYMQWQYNGETYFFICDDEQWVTGDAREQLDGTLYTIQYKTTETYEKTSTAFTLRPVIAQWYLALRNFAIVGLLSVLVYVGIRIMLCSTAQDKAKYKKMLVDWLIALCILFALHYLMVFIVNVTQKIAEAFTVTSIQIDGTDVFITNIRNMVTGNNSDSYFAYFGYVIMYLALVILTVIFTIQYIKRLVLLAFLTMVAPLIALTYPIDKIKDGQAQAFSFWIREYIFNSLLQPVHLILYTIFISSASQLVNVNPVYAVITLAFFTPAEKIFRKMFGFEKASSVNTIGAAAGGAMVMNMLNKLQNKSKGKENVSEKTNNKVRTAENNGKENIKQNEDSNPNTPTTPLNQISDNRQSSNVQNNSVRSGSLQNGNTRSVLNGGRNIQTANSSNNLQKYNNNNLADNNRKNGAVRTNMGNRRNIVGPNVLKSTGRWVANTAVKAAGAFGGATIGLAAGVASGDLGDTAKYTGAGAIAGANIASNVNNRIKNVARNFREYLENSEGQQDKNNVNYNRITEDDEMQFNESDIQERTKEFVENGITDATKIRMALQNGITAREYKTYEETGVNSVEDIVKLKKNEISADEYREYKNSGVNTIDDVISLKKNNIMHDDYEKYEKLGIRKADDIIMLSRNQITNEEYEAYSNSGIKSIEEIQMLKKEQITPDDIMQIKNSGESDVNKIINAKKKHPSYSKAKLASMFKLAKNAPKTLPEFKYMMVNTIFDGKRISDEDAEKIFSDLVDFF